MIEPGERFAVEYGNNRQVEVICLAGGKLGRLVRLLSDIQASEANNKTVEAFEDYVPNALAICLGDEAIAKTMWEESLDMESAMQIIQATIGKQALSEDELGKSE
jgi:hypothetical protein